MLTHLQEVVAEALIAFEGWPARKIARPEHVGAVGIRKEVVLLHRPAQGHVELSTHRAGQPHPKLPSSLPQIPG